VADGVDTFISSVYDLANLSPSIGSGGAHPCYLREMNALGKTLLLVLPSCFFVLWVFVFVVYAAVTEERNRRKGGVPYYKRVIAEWKESTLYQFYPELPVELTPVVLLQRAAGSQVDALTSRRSRPQRQRQRGQAVAGSFNAAVRALTQVGRTKAISQATSLTRQASDLEASALPDHNGTDEHPNGGEEGEECVKNGAGNGKGWAVVRSAVAEKKVENILQDADGPTIEDATDEALGRVLGVYGRFGRFGFHVNALACLATLMYGTFTGAAFGMLLCISVNGTKVMFIDGNVECYHPVQIVMFFLMTAVIGYPFALMWLCRRIANKCPAHRAAWETSVYNVLIVLYTKKMYWWEGQLLLRRVVLVATATFLADHARWRAYLSSIWLFFICLSNAYLRPFSSTTLHLLESYLLATLVLLSLREIVVLELKQLAIWDESVREISQQSIFNGIAAFLLITPLVVACFPLWSLGRKLLPVYAHDYALKFSRLRKRLLMRPDPVAIATSSINRELTETPAPRNGRPANALGDVELC